MKQGKTLAELDVKPGDVVEGTSDVCERKYTKTVSSVGPYRVEYDDGGWDFLDCDGFQIVSRATPVMTLPNGDILREGDYANLRSGDVVGPLAYKPRNSSDYPWQTPFDIYAPDGRWCPDRPFRHDIIAKAPNPRTLAAVAQLDAKDDTPKTWGEMTDAEKGALLLAHHEHSSNVQQWWSGGWHSVTRHWIADQAYRIAPPKPVRETVTLWWDVHSNCGYPEPLGRDTHKITFDLIDGQPDPDSIRLVEVTE